MVYHLLVVSDPFKDGYLYHVTVGFCRRACVLIFRLNHVVEVAETHSRVKGAYTLAPLNDDLANCRADKS